VASSRQNPLLPVSVQDQLRLYEAELRRMVKQEGASAVACQVHILKHAADSRTFSLCVLPILRFGAEGVLYSDFTSERQYVAARDYAQQLRVMVHDVGAAKRMFFVTADGHDVIRSYVGQLQAGIGDD
jgi:hypothetical protein